MAEQEPCISREAAQLLAALENPFTCTLFQKVTLVKRKRLFQRLDGLYWGISSQCARLHYSRLERLHIPPVRQRAVERVTAPDINDPFRLTERSAHMVERLVEIAPQLCGGSVGPEVQPDLLFRSGVC